MNMHSHTDKRKKFSIVTPCYQGARFLPGLHASLKALALKNPCFEWIIVDDFSNDNDATVSTIREIANETAFVIKTIFFNENYCGAKSTASASEIAEGEYIIILDQDDRLTPDALEVFEFYINKYSHRRKFAGVCGRCVDPKNRIIGNLLTENELFTNELSIRHKTKIRGEMFQCTKTELIRTYFQELRSGFTNGYVWARLAQDGYCFVYINNVVRFYDTENPQSRSNTKKIRYVKDLYTQFMFYLDMSMRYMKNDPWELIKYCVHCERYKIHALSDGGSSIQAKSLILRLILIFVHPLARVLVMSDRSNRRLV